VTHQPDEAARWHALAPAEALERLVANEHGLAQDEAARRLERHGPNALPPRAARSALRRFSDQFRDLLIRVLIAAALVTALLAHWIDTAVILAVVLVNAIIGFVQEGKAEQALNAIRGMLAPKAFFDTRPVSLAHGAVIVAVGLALLVLLELEKAGRRRLARL